MKQIRYFIWLSEDGTATYSADRWEDGKEVAKNEACVFQNFNNALGQARVDADKFFAETKVEKGIIAKKELDDASRNTELSGPSEKDSPDTV